MSEPPVLLFVSGTTELPAVSEPSKFYSWAACQDTQKFGEKGPRHSKDKMLISYGYAKKSSIAGDSPEGEIEAVSKILPRFAGLLVTVYIACPVARRVLELCLQGDLAPNEVARTVGRADDENLIYAISNAYLNLASVSIQGGMVVDVRCASSTFISQQMYNKHIEKSAYTEYPALPSPQRCALPELANILFWASIKSPAKNYLVPLDAIRGGPRPPTILPDGIFLAEQMELPRLASFISLPDDTSFIEEVAEETIAPVPAKVVVRVPAVGLKRKFSEDSPFDEHCTKVIAVLSSVSDASILDWCGEWVSLTQELEDTLLNKLSFNFRYFLPESRSDAPSAEKKTKTEGDLAQKVVGEGASSVVHGHLAVLEALAARASSKDGLWPKATGRLMVVVVFSDRDSKDASADLLDQSLLPFAACIPETSFFRFPVSSRKAIIMSDIDHCVNVWDSVFAVKAGTSPLAPTYVQKLVDGLLLPASGGVMN